MRRLSASAIGAALVLAASSFIVTPLLGQEATATAELPVLVTSCGQSPGPVYLRVFLNRLGYDFEFNTLATVQDMAARRQAGTPFKSLIIVTGASRKGMGAAGVSIEQELDRAAELIAEARRQGMTVIGAHIEGMERRAQGAAPGDNTDEVSIDAVMPNADILLVLKEGDEDGRFTAISTDTGIPMILLDKLTDLSDVLKQVFGG
jgi:hypothetical protein